MLRPRPARWFEVLCPRGDSARIVGMLARTGSVETEIRAPCQAELRLQELSEGLATYRKLLPRYGRYWNRGRLSHTPGGATPRALLRSALARIDQWRDGADAIIDRLQDLEDERHRTGLCGSAVNNLKDSLLDFTLLNDTGPILAPLAAVLPEHCGAPPLSGRTVHLTVPVGENTFLLAVAPASDMALLEDWVRAVNGRLLPPPPWLRGRPADAHKTILTRLHQLDAEIARLYHQLDELHREHRMSEVLGDLSCLEWFTQQVGVLELSGEQFALVTGWTDARDCTVLSRALEQEDIPALLSCPPPPPGTEPPQLMDNPAWVRPFEVFARALGVPGGTEADPSILLALVVPLLFGYMFGDLGQGLVLFAAGWLLQGRFVLARLLMAGGASAAAFGLVFGSVFSLERLIPALWLHPLENPVTILAVPLVFGIALLSVGQVLDSLTALWRGELVRWLWTDAGFLVLYLGAVLSVLQPELSWAAALGLGWYLLGHARIDGPRGALAALGSLLEKGLQILVNTLSFARVGAFALAHAGLSSALLALMDATGSATGGTLVLIAGNLVIILLEGLVVSIQTTRLVLFEFFNRFLKGAGRVFRPLPPPPTFVQGESP